MSNEQQSVPVQQLEFPQAPAPEQHKAPQKRPFRAKRRGKLRRRRRVPVILQMSSVECGVACLAMILSYHGRNTGIAEIRDYCHAGRDGLSAYAIVSAARHYGLRVRPITLRDESFRYVTLPAIIHWEFNHYLVVERWHPRHIDVVDPASGRRRLSPQEFDAGFTGIVMMFEPGESFVQRKSAHRLTLRSYMARYSLIAPRALLQIFLASLLLQVIGLGAPILTKVLIDQIIPMRLQSVMTILALGMLILTFSQTVIIQLRGSLLIYLQGRVDMQMMLGFVERLLSLPLSFFLQRSSGDMLTRLSSNIVLRDTLNSQLISVILDSCFLVMYLLILLWQAPLFGGLVLVIGFLQVVLLLIVKRPVHDLASRELLTQGLSQGYMAEMLNGITTLKASGAEQRAFHHWSNLFFDQLNASIKRSFLSTLVDTVLSTLRALAPLLLLWIGTMKVMGGEMQVGTMFALNTLAASFLTPLSSLVSSGQRLQLVRSHLERIADVVEAEPEQQIQSVRQAPRLSGGVFLNHVSFRYDEQTPDVLKDITLHVQPGQKIAIVGRTGSGKSTLGKMLLGLHVPTEGDVIYDGIPLRTMDFQSVRAQFGVVMQDAMVFSGTIRQNIAFNDPEMDLERVVHAARLAALHEDIIRMPMGYETYVSEHGSALSGGQRQRLALARAVAHLPVILLLDEATSSLDVMTEQTVENNLKTLSCTQIIIAHRLSTIRHADLILVLDEGRIVESGTHQQLLLHNGYYATLIRSQLAHERASVLPNPDRV